MTVVTDSVDDMLDPILAVFDAPLNFQVEGRAVTAYLKGSAEMISWGRTLGLDRPILFEGPPIDQAVQYARTRSAQLVTGLNEETKRRLAQVISDGIVNKRGIAGLGRDIRAMFDDMSKVRAETIARFETSDSLQQAFIDRSHDMGVTGKEWIEIAPEDQDCLGNAAAGVVKINDPFPSGHQRPPAHPNCVCALAPVMI